MNRPSRVLVALLATGVAVFITTLLLPVSVAPSWVKFAQPTLLLVAAGLAIKNAGSYRSDLRRAFLMLAGFLVLYGLLNIEPLNDRAFTWLTDGYFRWLFVYQIVDYALLLGSCYFILKSVIVSRMSTSLWVVVALAVALGIAIVWNALDPYDQIAAINHEAANIYLFIRLFDALVVAALVPVVALYLKSARSEQKESASFATVLAGIIIGLVFVYIYELLSGDSLFEIAVESTTTGSLLDAIYILGYWTIAAGLLAHWLNHRLAFSDLDNLLEPTS